MKNHHITKKHTERPSLVQQFLNKTNIQLFLELDINSRLCAGKKECVTRLKKVKQKRFLTDTLKNLHKKFSNDSPENRLSYNFFCKNRPFWIKAMNINERDTCKCIKHANIELMANALYKFKIVDEKHLNDI